MKFAFPEDYPVGEHKFKIRLAREGYPTTLTEYTILVNDECDSNSELIGTLTPDQVYEMDGEKWTFTVTPYISECSVSYELVIPLSLI